MSPINRALWLNAKQELEMAIRDAPYPSPGARELVIKTTAVAINPADYKFQRVGMFLTSYPGDSRLRRSRHCANKLGQI